MVGNTIDTNSVLCVAESYAFGCLRDYNSERSHFGYRNHGRRPIDVNVLASQEGYEDAYWNCRLRLNPLNLSRRRPISSRCEPVGLVAATNDKTFSA